MIILLAIAPIAVFASPVIDISDEFDLNISGTWNFPINTQQGWMIAVGQQRDLLAAPLDIDDMTVDMINVQNLSQHGALIDHALRPCPDGGYLHIGSPGVTGDNTFFKYDVNLDLVQQGVIAQASPIHAANDPAAICSENFVGAGLAEQQGMRDYFRSIDADGTVSQPIELIDSPRLTGAGLIESNGHLIAVSQDATPELLISKYDTDFNLVENYTIDRAGPGIVHYWPSAIMAVEDRYLILSMGKDPAVGFNFDLGDMYLGILNSDFELMEWNQISYNAADDGGMRPWMDLDEDTLIIGYDKLTAMHLYRVTLDLDEMSDLEASEEIEDPNSNPNQKTETDTASGCFHRGALFPIALLLVRRRHRKKVV